MMIIARQTEFAIRAIVVLEDFVFRSVYIDEFDHDLPFDHKTLLKDVWNTFSDFGVFPFDTWDKFYLTISDPEEPGHSYIVYREGEESPLDP